MAEIKSPEKLRAQLYAICKKNKVNFKAVIQEALGKKVENAWDEALSLSPKKLHELIKEREMLAIDWRVEAEQAWDEEEWEI